MNDRSCVCGRPGLRWLRTVWGQKPSHVGSYSNAISPGIGPGALIAVKKVLTAQVRRPTKDVDANAVGANVSAEDLALVVRDHTTPSSTSIAAISTSTRSPCRRSASRPTIRAYAYESPYRSDPWKGVAAWDVSTGDPIVPPPRQVTIDRILGEPITLLGYAPQTTIAEKGVTILERGITSTRWRDYVDIVRLARQGIDADELLRAARAVARHRGVTLEPVAPHLAGYGAVAQAKWVAWRRKERLESVCEENLDDQIALVVSCLDHVFVRGTE